MKFTLSHIKGQFSRYKQFTRLVLFALFFGLSWWAGKQNSCSPEKYTASFQEKILHLEQKAAYYLDSLYSIPSKANDGKTALWKNSQQLEKLYEEHGIAFLIYENDSLTFWSSNAPGLESYTREICLNNPVVQLKNGMYQIIEFEKNKHSVPQYYAIILLQNQYIYQNKYLNNQIPVRFGLPHNTRLEIAHQQTNSSIKNSKGEDLVNISYPENVYHLHLWWWVSIGLFTLSIILLLQFLQTELFRNIKKSQLIYRFGIYTAILIGIRALLLLNQIPDTIYHSGIYQAATFGNANSFWFPYFGDILINTLGLLHIAHVYYSHFQSSSAATHEENKATDLEKWLPLLFSTILLSSLFIIIHQLFFSLIENSNIPFRITQLFQLNLYSIGGFLSLALLYLAFYLISFVHVSQQHRHSDAKKNLLFSLLPFVLILCIPLSEGLIHPTIKAWPLLVGIFLYFRIRQNKGLSFSFGLLIIAVYSFITTFSLFYLLEGKEKGKMSIYAEKLADKQDAVAENLFADISQKIKKDTKLQQLIHLRPFQPNLTEQRLRQTYFSGYWERFDVRFALFDSTCLTLIKQSNPLWENNAYFDELINKSQSSTYCKDLFLNNSISDKSLYIARIPLGPEGLKNKPMVLYAWMEPKLNPDAIGFPELLLDKSIKNNQQLNEYSYAVYRNGHLLHRFGKYPYNFKMKKAEISTLNLDKNEADFKHHYFPQNDTSYVIISEEKNIRNELFTTYSYFFMFFSTSLLLLLYVKEYRNRKFFQKSSLSLRIQLMIFSIVLLSLGGFGTASYYLIQKQFEEKNMEILDEKIKLILVHLKDKFGDISYIPENYKEYSEYVLQNLSNTFGSDITIFDLKGNAFASSQARLFESGIISKKINPRVMEKISQDDFVNLILKENIGSLNYYSAYQPFYNNEGKLLAYINLPYFSRQDELQREVSHFVVTLLNIYMVLFAISTIIAIFISNLVTRPLRFIQSHLSNIRFDKKNEAINWKEKDEIGSLVVEYNKMILQLEESAEKLAQSERESAWREMAKQVAHEIKNPLTPMKLSVQHLQRVLDAPPEELKEKIQVISKMLIEQIDTLTHITNEFSHFAKMPKPNIETIILDEIISSTVALFSQNENIQIRVLPKENKQHKVKGDKEQFIRVLTNLIKNAIQAIPEQENGLIEISIRRENNQIITAVKDNGSGIAPESLSKIFVPNFSTKTEGMGLGLAMVKNILQSCDGKIWFETTRGKGTTFYFSLAEAA